MFASDDEELELYAAFLIDPDPRMIAPPVENEPSVRISQPDQWRERHIWEGYLLASRILVLECVKSQYAAGRLIFPALFNLRHAIEVALKYHIRYAGGEVPKRGEHDLELLIELFKETASGLDDNVNYISEDILDRMFELALLDPRSVTFRYSSSIDQKPVEDR